jgi:uncharacterized phiE125 gp8 family phage protein
VACNPECAWSLTTAPVIEPFTVAEAKAQIRSVQNQEDAVILGYIKAARAACETYLFRGLLTQSWTLALSEFVSVIPLPMATPLASVTSVKYYDTNGVQQTLSNTIYDVDTRSRPGRISLGASQTWPAVQSLRRLNRIEIQYIVGWTSAALIPEDIKQGMRVFIGACDADRDGMGIGTEQALRVAKSFWTDRVYWVPPQYDEGTY